MKYPRMEDQRHSNCNTVCFWGHWKRFFDVDKDVGHIAVFSPQLLGTVKYNGLISGEDVFFPVSSAAPISDE